MLNVSDMMNDVLLNKFNLHPENYKEINGCCEKIKFVFIFKR